MSSKCILSCGWLMLHRSYYHSISRSEETLQLVFGTWNSPSKALVCGAQWWFYDSLPPGAQLLHWCRAQICHRRSSNRWAQLPTTYERDHCGFVATMRQDRHREMLGHAFLDLHICDEMHLHRFNRSFLFVASCFVRVLQLHWHMGSINRTSLPLRRSPGPWCLSMWATLPIRSQSVPSTKESWRLVVPL